METIIDCETLTEDEFVERFLCNVDESVEEINVTDVEHNNDASLYNNTKNQPSTCEVECIEIPKNSKGKRRSNLTEFGPSQPAKRKNECAKRELTSIVTQLGKIDKQLNTKTDKRVSINFIAKFTSFSSNRQSTFVYPPDAKIQQTLLDHDTTISAVKNAVKEAWNECAKKEIEKECSTVVATTDVLVTPTKTISAFTTLPSPVTVKGQPLSAKNLCAKNSCTFGKKLRKPVWIKCSYRNDEGQQCTYWVHAPCIGFPSLKASEVNTLDGWCCPDHTNLQFKQK